jgi:hypothetical protein
LVRSPLWIQFQSDSSHPVFGPTPFRLGYIGAPIATAGTNLTHLSVLGINTPQCHSTWYHYYPSHTRSCFSPHGTGTCHPLLKVLPPSLFKIEPEICVASCLPTELPESRDFVPLRHGGCRFVSALRLRLESPTSFSYSANSFRVVSLLHPLALSTHLTSELGGLGVFLFFFPPCSIACAKALKNSWHSPLPSM